MQENRDYLSGTLSTIILALLKDQNRMYGYEICQRTKEITNDEILLTEGAIYPALHKLEKKGLLISSKEKFNGRVRKYYQLNTKATADIDSKIQGLSSFVSHINNILKPALK